MNSLQTTVSSFLLAIMGASGCAVAESPESLGESEAALTTGGPHLLWQNTTTGELSAWVLNGTNVVDKQPLDASGILLVDSLRCRATNSCFNLSWKAVQTRDNTILWNNPATGQYQEWQFDYNGNVTRPKRPLSWTCTNASGCEAAWKPIGRTSTPGTGDCGDLGCFSQDGLLWHNSTTGEVSRWDLDSSGTPATSGTNVSGKTALSWKCGPTDGCSQAWKPILTADFDNDGNSDVLWHNAATGAVSAWMVKGATVVGTRELSWKCDTASGCAQQWKVVGAADVNRDRRLDLTWHNPTTGQVSTWLLSDATVTGASELSRKCDAECSRSWKPLGYVSFPQLPPR